MGKDDTQTLDYFDDNRIFADFGNGYLFRGRSVILPEQLKDANKELLHTVHPDETKVIRDNVKKYYNGSLLCIYVLEHQKNIDYHMVLRNLLAKACMNSCN